jgi:hypothetical protein
VQIIKDTELGDNNDDYDGDDDYSDDNDYVL